MKHLVIILALFPLLGFGQEINLLKKQKISVGLTISPDYCFRVLKGDSSATGIINNREFIEVGKFGNTSGISAAYSVTEFFSVELSVLYVNRGYQTKTISTGSSNQGSSNPDIPVEYSINYTYNFIDVPIKAKYYLSNGKSRLFVFAGGSANFFFKEWVRTNTVYQDGRKKAVPSLTGYSFAPVSFMAIVGLGFAHDISSKMFYKIEPNYRRSITPIFSMPVKEYPYSLGIEFGLYYRL